MKTSDYGRSEIAIPCDRTGQFEPRILEKRQVRTDEIEQKIMAMYAKSMSQRDTEDGLLEIYHIWTIDGLVYLTNIMDLLSGKIIAWTLSKTLEVSCVFEAINKA